MKNLIQTLVIFTMLIACSENEVIPVDSFEGHWVYQSLNAGGDLSMNFEVHHSNGVYSLTDFVATSPFFAGKEFTFAEISTWHKFIDKEGGFGGMQIDYFNSGRTNWVVFKFEYCTFYRQESTPIVTKMRVNKFEMIDMADNGRVLVSLNNQFFNKQL